MVLEYAKNDNLRKYLKTKLTWEKKLQSVGGIS
jgi:hypothetical protein